jgi:hypothetical protein
MAHTHPDRIPAPARPHPSPINPSPSCSNLQGQGLGGQLPLDTQLWSNLNTLTNLNLAGNSLNGYMPSQMAALFQIQYIALNDNAFVGPLPTSWAALYQLQGLDLSGNSMSGNLPAEVSGGRGCVRAVGSG